MTTPWAVGQHLIKVTLRPVFIRFVDKTASGPELDEWCTGEKWQGWAILCHPGLGESQAGPFRQTKTAESKRTTSCPWEQVTWTASQLYCLWLHYLPHHSFLAKNCFEQSKMESESRLTATRQSGVWRLDLLGPLFMPLRLASGGPYCLHHQLQLAHLSRPSQNLLFFLGSLFASHIISQCTSLPQYLDTFQQKMFGSSYHDSLTPYQLWFHFVRLHSSWMYFTHCSYCA